MISRPLRPPPRSSSSSSSTCRNSLLLSIRAHHICTRCTPCAIIVRPTPRQPPYPRFCPLLTCTTAEVSTLLPRSTRPILLPLSTRPKTSTQQLRFHLRPNRVHRAGVQR